jgi:hypothetical protein
MSSVQRYRTLIHYLTQIYSAKDSVARTDSMREGLDCIMTKIAPGSSNDWQIVLHDVRRLLNVWEAKETDDVAKSVVLQIVDMLKEFSQPVLSLRSERSVQNPVISHVVDYPLVDARISLNVEEKEEDEESDEDDDVVPVPRPGPEAEEEEEESEEDVPGPEPDASEEESDADAEAEEEEELPAAPEAEMEVEQITIRGKTYWHDSASGKLFAVVDEDDVGDEVGILVNGKMTALVRE